MLHATLCPIDAGPDNTITSDQLSSAQPQAEHVISISNTGAGALQHLQQALSDTLSQGSALSPGPMHKLSSTQSSGTASNAALVEPFQPGPQLDSNAMPITSPAATSRKVVLSEAEPVDPPTTDAASPDTEASARRAALQWKPMGRAANTPDKQDLGRRKLQARCLLVHARCSSVRGVSI